MVNTIAEGLIIVLLACVAISVIAFLGTMVYLALKWLSEL